MKSIQEAIVLSLCLSLIFSPTVVLAAPQGGKVVGGSASIHQSGANTTINQSSDRAVINWNSFDIARHEAVRHNMPSSSSAALHRVVGGGGASQIQGLLQSNGNIYLVNPAGVVIHKGARVDTNGFIATTRDIADSNFMKGKMVFDKPGLAGAQIINKGEITVKDSGLAALVAPSVRNEGLIAAKLGKVALASGEGSWSLDMHGDDLITFTVDENAVNSLHGANGKPLASVENSGSIKAEGGVVVLTAAQLDGIVGSVVNSGEISAASAEISGGMITFKGQGSGVDISNTGTLDVSSAVADAGSVRMDTDGKLSSSGSIAATGGKKGGKVTLTGKGVALKGSAKIDASGNTGGGTVLVGGNALGKGPERNSKITKVESGTAIHADARIKGDGGQVVVWSDDKTSFDGTITAKGGSEGGNGGHVETSGAILKIGSNAQVSTLAPKGLYGQWLLDPVDFVIGADGDMTGAQVSDALASNDFEIKSSQGKGGIDGNIIVNDDIHWSTNTKLTLEAENDILINGNITLDGDFSWLILTPKKGNYWLAHGKTINIKTGKLTISDNEYTIINSLYELNKIKNNLSEAYALGQDINLADTKNSYDGLGFEPLGRSSSTAFAGIFDGLGHKINNLYINRENEYACGLFGYTNNNAIIRNVSLINVDISGRWWTGGLVGHNNSYIYNTSVHGTIRGAGVDGAVAIGGLVGFNDNNGKIYNSYTNIKISPKDIETDTLITDIGFEYGGFVGRNYGIIDRSFSVGEITANGTVGGFAGSNNNINGNGEISNAYSTASVNGSSDWVGGFIGNPGNGTIKNCYSTGMVTNSHYTGHGGFAGGFYGDDHHYICQISNSYWDIVTSKQLRNPGQSSGLYGLTTSLMHTQNSFANWDFVDIWYIVENSDYPHLRMFTSGTTSTFNKDKDIRLPENTINNTNKDSTNKENENKDNTNKDNIKDNDKLLSDSEINRDKIPPKKYTPIEDQNIPQGDWYMHGKHGEVVIDISEYTLEQVDSMISDNADDIINAVTDSKSTKRILENFAKIIDGAGLVQAALEINELARQIFNLASDKQKNIENEELKKKIQEDRFYIPGLQKYIVNKSEDTTETIYISFTPVPNQGENKYIYAQITITEKKDGWSWKPSYLTLEFGYDIKLRNQN